MRKFNAKLFLSLMAGVVVLSGALFGIHYLQYQRIARALLYQARRAEEQGQTERMAQYLKRYLEFAPQDTAARARLGQAWTSDVFVLRPKVQLNGADQLNQVLIKEPNHPELRKAIIRVALSPTTLRAKMARDHLQLLWNGVKEPNSAVGTKERGELESFWGQLLEIEEKPIEAMTWYREALQHDPQEALNYVRLAALLRRQPESDPAQRERNCQDADELLNTLVDGNPHSYKAHLARWNYRREFNLLRDTGMPRTLLVLMRCWMPGSVSERLMDRKALAQALLKNATQDVEAAVTLAPEELDLLLAAADVERLRGSLSEDPETAKQHRQEARAHLQLGLQLQSKPGYRGASEQSKFQFLWHLANLLLDSRQTAKTATADGDQELNEAADAIAKMRQIRSVPPGAVDYLEGRLLLNQRKWAEASRRFEQARPQVAKRGELAYEIDLQLGQCYEKLEEPGLMLSAYERAFKWDTNSAAARLGMGMALWSMGRAEEAIKNYQTVMSRDQAPSEGWMDVARLQVLVQLRREQRDWKEAEAALERAEKLAPKLVEVKLLRAEVLAAQERFEDAEEFLVRSLDETPNEVELWIARAGLLERNPKLERDKRLERSKVILDAAQKQLGDRVELRLARVRMAVRQGAGSQTSAVLLKMEQDRSSFKPAEQSKLLDGLAEAHYLLGEIGTARKLWNEMAQLPMNQTDLRLRLLLFDLAMKDNDEKGMDRTLDDIHAIERGQGVYHCFGQAVRLIGKAKNGSGDRKDLLNEARLLLDQAANMRPTWSRIALARAEIEEMRGNPEEAIGYLKKAIEQGETSPVVIQRLVDALMQRQRYAEAEQELERQQKSMLVNSELGRLAANVALRQGNSDRALQLAQTAVNPRSKNFRDQIWHARMLFVANKDKEAFEKFRQAIHMADNQPEPYVAMVQFLAARGRGQEATAVIQEAQDKVPAEKRPLAIAQCYEALGLVAEARQFYETAIKQSPGDTLVLRAAAGFYLKTGQINEVVPILRAVVDGRVKASPESVEWARRGLAVVLAASLDYEQFKEALQLVGLNLDENGQLVRADVRDESTDAIRAKARVLATQPGQRQFRERAIELLEQLGRRQSLLPDDKYILALLYDAGNAWSKSREQLKELTLPVTQGEQPRYLAQAPQYMNRYVLGLIRNGDYEEAERMLDRLDAFEKQQRLKAGSFGTVELRAQLLEKTGQGDKAVSLLADYAKLNRETKDMILLVVGSLVRQNRFDEALALLEKEINTCHPEMAGAAYVSLLHEMKPTDEPFRRAENWLQGQLQQVEKQLPQMREPRKADELRVTASLLRQHLANLYDLRGRYPEAEAMYRRILQDHKTNVLALNNLSWLLAQRNGDGRTALELIDRAITNMGRRADLLDTRGLVYLALGDSSKALADFKEATDDDRTPTHLFHLARAHYEAKDRATATKVLLDAKKAGLEPSLLHPIEQLSCRQLMTELKVQ